MADLISYRSIIELWGQKDAHGARLASSVEVGDLPAPSPNGGNRLTDRLTLTRALESDGMQSEAAEPWQQKFMMQFTTNVATRTDLAAVRSDIREVELRLEAKIDRIVIWLGAFVVVVAGRLFAALQRWPPH